MLDSPDIFVGIAALAALALVLLAHDWRDDVHQRRAMRDAPRRSLRHRPRHRH